LEGLIPHEWAKFGHNKNKKVDVFGSDDLFFLITVRRPSITISAGGGRKTAFPRPRPLLFAHFFLAVTASVVHSAGNPMMSKAAQRPTKQKDYKSSKY
jgi:hypothetical protein